MLNFNFWNIGIISTICFLGIIYSLPNFTPFPKIGGNTFLPGKTINLGLDLQGGSYLLLEADINSVVNERLETVNDDVSRKLKEYDVIPLKKEIINEKLNIIFNNQEELLKGKKVLRQFFGTELSILSEDKILILEYSEFALKQIVGWGALGMYDIDFFVNCGCWEEV